MPRLKHLNEHERATFHKVIGEALINGWKAPEIQNILTEKIGVSFGQRMVQRYLEKTKKGETGPISEANKERESSSFKGIGSDKAEWNGIIASDRIVTLEDALKKSQVDLTKWDVATWEVTSWECGHKAKTLVKYHKPTKKGGRQLKEVTKEMKVTPLWRVSVKFKAKKGWNPSEFRTILLDDMKKLAPSYIPIQRVRQKDNPILAELSIFDAHFGKLAWSPETGQDYDIKICRDRYMNAARDLLARSAIHNPERIVYIVGNDFFHVDHKGQTTSGTEMDMDGRWQKAFRIGKDCCITIAEEASEIAPVDILVVPGNHDREKAFCLGEVLDARFHTNHEINVVNDPDPYVYYRWGKVLLGFNHGEGYAGDKKRADLPVQMSTDRAVDWSETVWREWHLGHFHSEDELVWRYRKVKQIRDVTVRVLPSLSSTDAWHRMSGYASPLAAECHLYHKDHGRWAYLVHQTEG